MTDALERDVVDVDSKPKSHSPGHRTTFMAPADQSPAVTYKDYPKDILLKEPKVRNEHDCDLALREMSFIAAHNKSLDAQIAEETNQLKSEMSEMFVYKGIDGKTMSYKDRQAMLQTALESYCDDQYYEVFVGKGTRSLKLTYGSVGFKKARDSVDYIQGRNAKMALDAIERLTESIQNSLGSLMERLRKCAASVVMFVTGDDNKKASLIVDVSAKISLRKALDSFQNNKLSREDLNKVGLKFVEGDDQFFCKPTEYQKPD